MSVQDSTRVRSSSRHRPRAIAHLKRQLTQSGAAALRLGVKESGCSGYMYELDFVTDADGRRRTSRNELADGVTVHVATEQRSARARHRNRLRGHGLNASSSSATRRAENECGCGESFSIATEEKGVLMERRIVVTTRDCPARLVPVGTPVTIPKGTFVTLTQALGGTYTVVWNGNMARVDGTDGDALGFDGRCAANTRRTPTARSTWPTCAGRSAPSTIPEIPVNIVDLGLVYGCELIEGRRPPGRRRFA